MNVQCVLNTCVDQWVCVHVCVNMCYTHFVDSSLFSMQFSRNLHLLKVWTLTMWKMFRHLWRTPLKVLKKVV